MKTVQNFMEEEVVFSFMFTKTTILSFYDRTTSVFGILKRKQYPNLTNLSK
jgi:hypothetical protein